MMRGWKIVAKSCIGRAFLVGGIWAGVNGTSTVNGVGLLVRQGWPFSSFGLFAGAGAAAGLIAGVRRVLADRRRGRELAELCAARGFDFAAEAAREDVPPLPLFQGWVGGRHLARGEWGGVPFRMLDVTSRERRSLTFSSDVYDRDGATERDRTVVLLAAEGVPPFDLRPRTRGARLLGWAGFRGVAFDPSGAADPAEAEEVRRFGERFRVAPFGQEADLDGVLRPLFRPPLMRALNRHPGCSVQVAEGTLAVWRGESSRPARGRPELLDAALAIRAALTGAAGAAGAVLPAPPGMDPASQRIRVGNAAIGGVAGLFLGFFLFGAFLFRSSINMHRFAAIFPLAFFGSLILGGAIGALLGARAPVRAAGRRRSPGPEVIALPRRRGDRLSLKPPWNGLLLGLPFAAMGWPFVVLGLADLLGRNVGMEGSPAAGVILGGAFVLIGHGVGFSTAWVAFDLAARTWRIARWLGPLRVVKAGSLDEASRVAVAREARETEESQVEMVVARLEWRDAGRKPLVLLERPLNAHPLRTLRTGVIYDSRPAIRAWARKFAALLALPLADET